MRDYIVKFKDNISKKIKDEIVSRHKEKLVAYDERSMIIKTDDDSYISEIEKDKNIEYVVPEISLSDMTGLI